MMILSDPYNMSIGTKEAYQLLHDGVIALSRVEQQGLRIDVQYIHKKKMEITNQIKKLETTIVNSDFYKKWKQSTKSTINIYSSTQLGKYLYDTKRIKIKKTTTTGKGATDEEALAQLGIPELDILLQIKKLKKIRDTYLDTFERETIDECVHPFYDLHLVKTYRSSSRSPNFQNIPRRDAEAMNICRKAIYPRKGHQLLELDFKQLEVCIATCYHNDPVMIKYIKTGHDFHLDFAKEIFKIKKYDKEKHKVLRNAAKNGFVFPEFYGDYYKNCAGYISSTWCNLPKSNWIKGQGILIGDTHISDHLIENDIRCYDDFERHIQKIEKKLWKRFKVYAQWKESWWSTYQKNGFFWSLSGFTYKGTMSKNDAINYPVQGAAFHVLLWSLIEATTALLRTTCKKSKLKTRIVGQIHDAIVLDVCPSELEQVVKIMKCIMEHDTREHFKWVNVPLSIDAELSPVDGSWADKQPYDISSL